MRKTPITAPPPPSDLGETGKQCWFGLLESMKDLEPRDIVTLELACRWFTRFKEAMQASEHATSEGVRIQRINEASGHSKQFLACLKVLGLCRKGRYQLRPDGSFYTN